MKEKFDFRQMRQELSEDEKVTKTRPVLVTQREIQELLKTRKAKGARRRPA